MKYFRIEFPNNIIHKSELKLVLPRYKASFLEVRNDNKAFRQIDKFIGGNDKVFQARKNNFSRNLSKFGAGLMMSNVYQMGILKNEKYKVEMISKNEFEREWKKSVKQFEYFQELKEKVAFLKNETISNIKITYLYINNYFDIGLRRIIYIRDHYLCVACDTKQRLFYCKEKILPINMTSKLISKDDNLSIIALSEFDDLWNQITDNGKKLKEIK